MKDADLNRHLEDIIRGRTIRQPPFLVPDTEIDPAMQHGAPDIDGEMLVPLKVLQWTAGC